MNRAVETVRTQYLVLGSGIAGLRAAIELARWGEVCVLTKGAPDDGSTPRAQGGVAAAMGDDDAISLHEADTLAAGEGLSEPAAVRALVAEGPARVRELQRFGARFDRVAGRLSLAREGAHSRRRILHARGDETGRELHRALLARAGELPRIRLVAGHVTVALDAPDGECFGAIARRERDGRIARFQARATLLATGGAAAIFSRTTNPPGATGDGLAMAYRAGADLLDLEFFQFHPTALALPGAPALLLTEALRGEGAVLRNRHGERFMPHYHAQGELAPRDHVSRAILLEVRRTRSRSVFLDVRHLRPGFLRLRFPQFLRRCASYGLDPTRQPIPVLPAAHYAMGGVRTDLNGRTRVARLYACGEVAGNGVHGANRLGSNSLLEGLVFGLRAARAAAEEPRMRPSASDALPRGSALPADATGDGEREVRALLWADAGVIRSAASLRRCLRRLARRSSLAERGARGGRRGAERASVLLVGELLVRSALRRTETRGAHFRRDFPVRDDVRWAVHQAVSRKGAFELPVGFQGRPEGYGG